MCGMEDVMKDSIKFILYHLIPDKIFLKIFFRKKLGYSLNLKNPKSFNEKLQWLKLNDRKILYTQLVDKYEVRKYIKNLIGDKYLIPILGIWNRFEDIDFNVLPNKFVLKCTHDSGSVIICKDKSTFDILEANIFFNKKLKENFYFRGKEWPYKNVKPRIIAENYMSDEENNDLKDYKFMCFNGIVKCCFVCSERFENNLKVTFFDNDWNVMPFERHYPKSNKSILKPKNFKKMIELAEKLSKNIPFVRVDFYEINNDIYFGELTFYPGCGFEEFKPIEWDYKLGEWIDLQKNAKN